MGTNRVELVREYGEETVQAMEALEARGIVTGEKCWVVSGGQWTDWVEGTFMGWNANTDGTFSWGVRYTDEPGMGRFGHLGQEESDVQPYNNGQAPEMEVEDARKAVVNEWVSRNGRFAW